MARDVFNMTLSNTDANDLLVALEGIQISVVRRGTATPVTIYQRPTGATQGPTPECGATGGPNPFTTGPSGSVEFWADGPTEVDVKIHDTVGPSRVADRTFGWNAVAVGVGSIPTATLAADAGLTLAMLGADILRQVHQIGEVIDWWRPDVVVPVPTGYVICDGRSVAAGQHDFAGVAGSINVPDLRNAFVLGADSTKSDGTAAAGTDPVASAPGIRGSGGSHQHTLIPAETAMKAHNHGGGNHSHGVNNSSHVGLARVGGSHWAYATDAGPVAIQTGAIDLSGTIITTETAANGTAHNNTPKYVGLLKIIKVKRS